MEQRHDVVIVGGGPVGVGLAVDLGLRGISCAVVERRTGLSAIPKGQGLSQRTMEHFWSWGLADDIRAARTMPADHPIGQVTVYESLLGEFWRASPDRAVVQDYYFQVNERLPQYATEEVLRRRLRTLPSVELLLGATATAVEQDADGVRVTVGQDGAERVLTGSYLVGCDGGRSLVREQADIARHGTNWDEVVALVVFRSRDLHDALDRFPPRSTYRVLHPDLKGYWMFFGRVDVGEEFFFHAPVPAGTTPETFDPTALLRRAAGFDVAVEVDHVGFWDLRVQVADRYRSGRAFIAGDAAHTHPPYGGFGLNNGLEDARNLGWKLAAVLGGWGGDALLESYGLERQPVFRDVGEEIIGGWIAGDRAFLETRSPADDPAAFAAEFAEVTKEYGRRLSSFEPHYDGSPVIAGPADGVTSGIGVHTCTARAGHHLPPLALGSGRNVFEELGHGFTVLASAAPAGATDALEAAARELGVPLTVVRDPGDGAAAAYGARLVLVRPDQFVAWTGDEAPPDPAALLSKVTGRS